MENIFNEMGLFAVKTFPDAGIVEHLRKLEHEIKEAIERPKDIEEYADCLLALFGAAFKANFSYSELMYACKDKLKVVKSRKWAKLPDGTYQHIKVK